MALPSERIVLTIVEIGDVGSCTVEVCGKRYEGVYVPYAEVEVGQQYEATLNSSGMTTTFEEWRRRGTK